MTWPYPEFGRRARRGLAVAGSTTTAGRRHKGGMGRHGPENRCCVPRGGPCCAPARCHAWAGARTPPGPEGSNGSDVLPVPWSAWPLLFPLQGGRSARSFLICACRLSTWTSPVCPQLPGHRAQVAPPDVRRRRRPGPRGAHPQERHRARPHRPRLSVRRAARHGQDLHRADLRQGAQLRRRAEGRLRPRRTRRARPSPTAPAST